MGSIFSHHKTNLGVGMLHEQGNQLNTPFNVAADGSYSAVADVRFHGLPTSSVQLEKQSPGGWQPVASFPESMQPMHLSLKAGTYRISTSGADVYHARISS